MGHDEHEEVGDDVQWWLDPDGTEWFVEQGVRFELAEDGIAYPVVGGTTDPAGATPLAVEVVEDPGEPADPEGPDPVERDAEPRAPAAPLGGPDTGPGGEPLLRIGGLDAGYGSLPVLHGVDLEIGRGRTAVLLGLNGAGKTTTALTVCGALAPWAGGVTYDGRDVTGWDTRAAVRAGVVMVPEGRRVFSELSVEKNLQVGAWTHRDEDELVREQRERVYDYFPRLRERAGQLAGTLSGGEQQMLAIGRGLMARPRLLIIDEASMGLAPVIVRDVFEIVRQINQDGVTVLLIEQNVGALEVADLGFVMEQGRVVRRLEGEQLRDRSAVSEALMG